VSHRQATFQKAGPAPGGRRIFRRCERRNASEIVQEVADPAGSAESQKGQDGDNDNDEPDNVDDVVHAALPFQKEMGRTL